MHQQHPQAEYYTRLHNLGCRQVVAPVPVPVPVSRYRVPRTR
jgi:hypothetical protein